MNEFQIITKKTNKWLSKVRKSYLYSLLAWSAMWEKRKSSIQRNGLILVEFWAKILLIELMCQNCGCNYSLSLKDNGDGFTWFDDMKSEQGTRAIAG